jgi:hypothetical protein
MHIRHIDSRAYAHPQVERYSRGYRGSKGIEGHEVTFYKGFCMKYRIIHNVIILELTKHLS